MSEHLGSDFSAVSDINSSLTRVDGEVGLGQAGARRLSTPGGRKHYDLNYGFDMRQFVNAPATKFRAERGAEMELVKDERVLSADVTVIFIQDEVPPRLKVNATMQSEDGPFDLTLDVTALTVEILREET